MPNEQDPLLLSAEEQVGFNNARAEIMVAKAGLCDSQHALQEAQEMVESAQKVLALATARLNGALMLAGHIRGLTGAVRLSRDGTRIEA